MRHRTSSSGWRGPVSCARPARSRWPGQALPALGASLQETTSDAVNPGHHAGSPLQSQDAASRSSADEDAGLLQAYAAGDARAFDALYRKHRPWLYRVILRQIRDVGRADEIFQEVWLGVTRRASEWTPQSQVATWLYGIARSRIVDGWPQTGTGETMTADATLPATAAGTAAVAGTAATAGTTTAASTPTAATGMQALPAEQLIRALDQLPPLQREAYLLAVEAGLSPGEVARATGSTLDGARSRVRSARALLACTLVPQARAARPS